MRMALFIDFRMMGPSKLEPGIHGLFRTLRNNLGQSLVTMIFIIVDASFSVISSSFSMC